MKNSSLQSTQYPNNLFTLLAFSDKPLLQESFPTCSHDKWMQTKADLGPVSIWFVLEMVLNQTH